MADLIERSAALRIIFDNVGKPATEIYQLVRELPAADAPERAGWVRASALLPPMEREERDEEEATTAKISVPVLAIVRDGTYQVVRHIEETALERDGTYEWIGWVREPDDGTAEEVTHWMLLPEGPK